MRKALLAGLWVVGLSMAVSAAHAETIRTANQSPAVILFDEPLSNLDAALAIGPARLGIRPEHMKLAEGAERDLEAEIVVVERLEGDVAIRAGFAIDRAGCHLFATTARPSAAPDTIPYRLRKP